MRLLDYLLVALKNLTRQKARTVLTIIAITVGSFSLILMTSIILSIRQSLIDQFQNLGAFDLVSVVKDPNSVNTNSLIGNSGGDPTEGKLMDDTTLLAMRQLPHVAEATPTINNFGFGTMRLAGQDRKTWASLLAYDPNNDVFNLPITAGRRLLPTDLDKIIVGSRFIQDMNFKGTPASLIGQKVLLNYKSGGGSAPDWGALPEPPPRNADKSWYESKNNASLDIPVEIVGITGGALDDGQSYITLGWARRLMVNVRWDHQPCERDKPCSDTLVLAKEDNFIRQGYGSIILKADDTANIAPIAEAVKKLGYGANTAQAMLDQINKILLMISVVLAVIGGISLFVAAIGIINTMVMAIYERTREIGVMRACGATRATIRHLFTVEAGLLGFWGGVCGLVVSYAFAQVGRILVTKYGGATLGSLPVDHLGDFPWWLVVAVIAFTTILGMVSGLVPAIRAARLKPVDALRYE